jgi:hypothetical protein
MYQVSGLWLAGLLIFGVLGAFKYLVEWMQSLPVDQDYPYSEYPNEEDEDDYF